MADNVFTGNKDIDINILLSLKDEDLMAFCRINKYVASICRKNKFWKLKIQQITPGFPILDNYINKQKQLYLEISELDFQELSTWATKNGYIDVLEWLHKHSNNSDLRKNKIVNIALEYDLLNVLKWLKSKKFIFTEHDADQAAYYQNIDILDYLKTLNVIPSDGYVTNILEDLKLDSLKWFLEHGIFPEQTDIDLIVLKNNLEVLGLLADHDLFPSEEGANSAAEYGFIDILHFLINYYIYPNQEGINESARAGQTEILDMLAQFDQYPNKDAYDLIFYNDYVQYESKIRSLNWLIDHKIYPRKKDIKTAISIAKETEDGEFLAMIIYIQTIIKEAKNRK